MLVQFERRDSERTEQGAMEAKPSYGAVEVPKGDIHYDENALQYLEKSKFSFGRFARAVVPIIIAVLIMGGLAWGMTNGFAHFYGPPKGGDDGVKQDESWIPTAKEERSSTSGAKAGAFTCSSNQRCSSLGLAGNCCPTDEGVTLGCCD